MGLIRTLKTFNLLKKRVEVINAFINDNKDKVEKLKGLYEECIEALEFFETRKKEIEAKINNAKLVIKKISEVIKK